MNNSLELAFDAWAKAWRKEALVVALATMVIPTAAERSSRALSDERIIEELALIPK